METYIKMFYIRLQPLQIGKIWVPTPPVHHYFAMASSTVFSFCTSSYSSFKEEFYTFLLGPKQVYTKGHLYFIPNVVEAKADLNCLSQGPPVISSKHGESQ